MDLKQLVKGLSFSERQDLKKALAEAENEKDEFGFTQTEADDIDGQIGVSKSMIDKGA